MSASHEIVFLPLRLTLVPLLAMLLPLRAATLTPTQQLGV